MEQQCTQNALDGLAHNVCSGGALPGSPLGRDQALQRDNRVGVLLDRVHSDPPPCLRGRSQRGAHQRAATRADHLHAASRLKIPWHDSLIGSVTKPVWDRVRSWQEWIRPRSYRRSFAHDHFLCTVCGRLNIRQCHLCRGETLQRLPRDVSCLMSSAGARISSRSRKAHCRGSLSA